MVINVSLFKKYLEMATSAETKRTWDFPDNISAEQKKSIQRTFIGRTPTKDVATTVNLPDKTSWKVTGSIPGKLKVIKTN